MRKNTMKQTVIISAEHRDNVQRGEMSAVFYHVFSDMPRYRVGDRIGQIKLGMALPMGFEVVDTLDDTERGERGYGSTGR